MISKTEAREAPVTRVMMPPATPNTLNANKGIAGVFFTDQIPRSRKATDECSGDCWQGPSKLPTLLNLTHTQGRSPVEWKLRDKYPLKSHLINVVFSGQSAVSFLARALKWFQGDPQLLHIKPLQCGRLCILFETCDFHSINHQIKQPVLDFLLKH